MYMYMYTRTRIYTHTHARTFTHTHTQCDCAEEIIFFLNFFHTAPQTAEGSLPYMAVTVQQKQPMGKRDDVEVCACVGWGGGRASSGACTHTHTHTHTHTTGSDLDASAAESGQVALGARQGHSCLNAPTQAPPQLRR